MRGKHSCLKINEPSVIGNDLNVALFRAELNQTDKEVNISTPLRKDWSQHSRKCDFYMEYSGFAINRHYK